MRFKFLFLVIIWCLGANSAPTPYSTADVNNSRTLVFPVIPRQSNVGTANDARYRAFTDGTVLRVQQAFEFRAPATADNSTMEVAIYVKNYVPWLTSNPSNSTLRVYLIQPDPILSSSAQAILKNSLYSSLLSDLNAPSIRRNEVLKCDLPSLATLGTDVCPQQEFLCGVAYVRFPTILAGMSTMGLTQQILVSVSTQSLVPKTSLQDSLCNQSMSVTAIWSNNTSIQFRELLKYTSNSFAVEPDALVLTEAAPSQLVAQNLITSQFTQNSDPQGSLWTPLLIDDTLRFTFPFGSTYSRFTVTNYSAGSLAFKTSAGFVCAVDDSLLAIAQATPTWSINCTMPLKDAVYGSLQFRLSEALNISNWLDGVSITLQSKANLSLPTRTLTCAPQSPSIGRNGCRVYSECTPAPIFFGVGDGSGQQYTEMVLTWSPHITGFTPPIVSDNDQTNGTACSHAITASLSFVAKSSVANAYAAPVCDNLFQFLCKADATCISNQQYCDGVADCSDGADEVNCDRWTMVRTSGSFPLCSNAAPQNAHDFLNTFTQCLKYAQTHADIIGGVRFVSVSGISSCEFFHKWCIDGLRPAQIASNTTATSDDVAVLVLQLDPIVEDALRNVYSCTSLLTCNGKGQARSVTIPALQTASVVCICTCSTAFSGTHCEVENAFSGFPAALLLFSDAQMAVNASLLSSIGSLAPAIGVIWVHSVFAESGFTKVAVGAENIDALVSESVFKVLSTSVPSFVSANASVEPIVLQPVVSRCKFDDVSLATSCVYLRSNTSTPVSLTIHTLQPLIATTVTASMFFENGTALASNVGCTVLDMKIFPDMSHEFIQEWGLQSSWCPATTTCHVGDVSGSVVAIELKFTLPLGWNSTQLTVPCNQVSHFENATILPQLVVIPRAMPIVDVNSIEVLTVTSDATTMSLGVFVACLILAVISVGLFFVCRRQDVGLNETSRLLAESQIAMKRLGLKAGEQLSQTAVWSLRVVAKATRGPQVKWYWHPRRHIAMWITTALLFVGLGVVALIYYSAATPTRYSNYVAVVQVFQDKFCNASTNAPFPIGAVTVMASDQCIEPNHYGKLMQWMPNHYAVSCGTGTQIGPITIKYGEGETTRCDSGTTTVDNGACVSLKFKSKYGLAATLNSIVTCFDGAAFNNLRRGLLERYPTNQLDATDTIVVQFTQEAGMGLSSGSAAFDDSTAGQQVAPFLVANPNSITDPITQVQYSQFFYYDTLSKSTQFSSSGNSYMLSTAIGDQSTLAGPSNVPNALLVYQSSSTLLSSDEITDIDAYEAKVPLSEKYLPRTSQNDVPVGRFFNGYGGGNSTSTDSVIKEMLYYPGSINQDQDIGASEATISFWLRAGTTTRGFAAASTDNWRTTSGSSPLLDRLERMILNNDVSASAWFTDGWSVYWAIYIDGINRRIHFVAAGPLSHTYIGFQGYSVFQEIWDLDSLGLGRVFTNRWHHIAVVIEIPTNQDQSGGTTSGFVLRLVVDGQTMSGSQGFLKCLPRQIEAVNSLWTPPVSIPADSIVVQGGVIIVGALNAGLYGVMVTSAALAQSDVIALGTVPMNNFFNINTSQFLALGFYVTFMSFALFCMMMIGVIAESVSERRKRILGEAAAADAAFLAVMETSLNATKMKVNGKELNTVHVDVCKIILGLEDTIFATLLSEILKLAGNPDAARADFLAIIWVKGQANYVCSTTQLETIRTPFKSAEKSELTRDGQFLVPSALWNDFATEISKYYDELVEKRVDNSKNLQQGGPKKLQVKVAKVKVKVKVKVKAGKAGGGKGGKGGRSGTSLRRLTNSIKLNAAAPIQMIMPVILAVQAAGVYAVNFALPTQYLKLFKNFYIFFQLAWVSIPNIPDLYYALFQFVIAIAVTMLLIYYCVSDHDPWIEFVGLYAARRDELDKERVRLASEPPKTKSERKSLLIALQNDDDLDDDYLYSEEYNIDGATANSPHRRKSSVAKLNSERSSSSSSDDDDEDRGMSTPPTLPLVRQNWYDPMLRYVLPLRLTIPLDEFIDKSRRSNLVKIHRKDFVPAPFPRKKSQWEVDYDSSLGLYVVRDINSKDVALPLNSVNYLCPLHRSVLVELEQRDTCVKPYQCFVVNNNERCGMKEGTMYCCRSKMPDGKFCPYSVCQLHMRTSIMEFLKITIKSSIMEMVGEGLSSFIAFVAISLTSVIYFPVVQVGLQFLTCDPQYACLFPHCWSDPDGTFILAASVVFLLLVFVGFGMPAVMYWELWRRKVVLFALFHRKEYHKIYLAVDEDAMEELEEQEEAAKKSMFLTDKPDPTEVAGVFGFLAKFFSKNISGETTQDEAKERLSILHKNTVDFGEWERFLGGDNSAMQLLYRFLEYEYITLPPFLMLYRVAVLIPTVFVTDNLFVQMTASAIVEVGFGTFIFWTEPYVNPWVDTMYRAGSVHNIALIGLSAMNVMLNAENSSIDLTFVILGVTGIYFLFVVGLIFMTTIWPTISFALTQISVANQMKGVGMRTIDMSSVFLNPFIHTKVFCNIVELLLDYHSFSRRHPECNPGDDLNSRGSVDEDQTESAALLGAHNSPPRQSENSNTNGKGSLVKQESSSVFGNVFDAKQARSREEVDEEADREAKTSASSKPGIKGAVQGLVKKLVDDDSTDSEDCEDDLQRRDEYDS